MTESVVGFRPSYFEDLAQLEEGNFWFRARNKLILWAIEHYVRGFHSFLEIGCGTGYVLSGISQEYTDADLYGSEILTAGLGYAAHRVPSAQFMQMDARNIPFFGEFDVVGAFDVIEHISEDDAVLKQIFDALKPNGFLLLTVPQHGWLWSIADDYALHARRYSAGELHRKLRAAGFLVVRSTSFVSLLLPAMMLSRFLHRNTRDDEFDATAEMKLASWMNSVFLKILGIEQKAIQGGVNFPVGGSRLVVAKKY